MEKKSGISVFERYLSLWVVLCMIVGTALGKLFPSIPEKLSLWEYENVSLPIAFLIWLMIYPMMLKVDFQSIKNISKMPEGLIVTCVTNWMVKPLTMFAIAGIFFCCIFGNLISSDLSRQYLAGAVLLGAAPCTAMVFVWSYLTKGDATYTLIQVAVNDLIILVAFAPIVAFFLGIGGIKVPYSTLFLSVFLFIVIPLIFGILTRSYVVYKRGLDYFNNQFIHKFDKCTILGLLLTLVILFSFQGEKILENQIHILLIAIPLILQTFLMFFFAYFWCWLWKLPHNIAAPAGMIGASNFFELSVAVAVSLYGLHSGATLVTVVGVLVEVPVMLSLVNIANKTRHLFELNVSKH